MSLRTPPSPNLPSDLANKEDVLQYLKNLRVNLDDLFRRVYQDFFNGNSQFREVTTTPTVADLDEGEFLLYKVGSTFRIYSRLGNDLVYVGISVSGGIVEWSGIINKPSSTVANIDSAVSLKHTQGTDLGLDTGGVNAVVVVDIKDAVTKKHAQGHAMASVSDHTDWPDGLDITELGYVKGVTSALQTQLGDKAPVASPSFTTKITTPIIDLTGGQIAFPVTQAVSANANTLDDYEEGAWTPGLKFGGAKVGITYDAANTGGLYTKIGRQVTCTGVFALTSKGSSVGAATIMGLPFTSGAAIGNFSTATIAFNVVTFADAIISYLTPATDGIVLYEVTNAGVRTAISNADFANTSTCALTIVYFV